MKLEITEPGYVRLTTQNGEDLYLLGRIAKKTSTITQPVHDPHGNRVAEIKIYDLVMAASD